MGWGSGLKRAWKIKATEVLAGKLKLMTDVQ